MHKLYSTFYKNKLSSFFILFATLFIIINSLLIYKELGTACPDPGKTLISLIVNFILLITIFIILLSSNFSLAYIFLKKGKQRVSKLRRRIIIAFSISATLPTIIVAIFSTYFFNFGIQTWFDNKISRVLEQSVFVGESYIEEHKLQLKETALSVAYDINLMYYDLVHNTEMFNRVLNAQAKIRSLDEAIIFQKKSNTVIAQTSLSFSLAFATIPSHLIDRADNGEVVKIPSNPSKIRMLIKLHNYDNIYLLIGRLVDTKIINHIDKTNGAAQEYFKLKHNALSLQIKFSIIFILFALALLLFAIVWGTKFAEKLVKPIRNLVIAAEKVHNGDYNTQVPEDKLKKDEVKVLSNVFNRMVRQINQQHKELAVAERALAWSDIARKIAHEIKNPLTPISLATDRLLKKYKHEVSDPDAFEKYITIIQSHNNDIKNIVSEFTNFAKMPSAILKNNNIISIVGDIVDSRRLIHDTITYKFNTNIVNYIIPCDQNQINQIMINLLKNSEEALENKCRGEKLIEVSINIEGNILEIIILDNGHGFDKKMLPYAKDAYITDKTNGTGLGLAIVERMVQDHYGKLTINNNHILKDNTSFINKGAVVKLTFDIAMLRKKITNQ